MQRQRFKTPPEALKCQTMRRQHFNKSSFSSLLEFINTPAAAHGLNRLQSTAIAAWAGEIALEGVGRGCNLEKRRLTDGGEKVMVIQSRAYMKNNGSP